MDEEEILAGISASEQDRLVRRATWSLPLYFFAVLQVVAGVVLLVVGEAIWLSALISTIFWGVIAGVVSPSMKQYGEDVSKVIYARAMGKVFGTFGKIVAGVLVWMLIVWAYGQLDTAKEKLEEVYDAANAAIATDEEEGPPPTPAKAPSSADALESERLELERQRLELEQERLKLEAEKQSQQAAMQTTTRESSSSIPADELSAVDPDLERQKENEATAAKAIDWLVPYLARIVRDVESEQFYDGEWIATHITRAKVQALGSQRIGIDQYNYHDSDDGSKAFSNWAAVDMTYLRRVEIGCSEYDLRPRSCMISLWTNRGGVKFEGALGRCFDSGCAVQLRFYESDMDTARRVENAFNDIIDLIGNREPY